MKVIVVGAGTAGLAAIHTLKRRGADVVALEEKDAAGGRIAGAWKNGYALDLGAQFFFKFFDTAFQLCRELGLSEELVTYLFKAANWRNGKFHIAVINSDPRVLWRNRKDLLSSQGFTPGGALQMARFLPVLIKRRHDLDYIDFERSLDLDKESVSDFALRVAGEEVLEGILGPVTTNLTLGEPEDVGAGYGLALLWYAIHGVWTLERGMGTLASRLYEECKDSIRLLTPARRIVIEGGAVKGVETAEGFLEADAVICATTATTALKIIPDLPDPLRKPLGKARCSACCHVMFALRNKLFPGGWYGVGFPGRSGMLINLCDNAVKSPHYAPEGGSLIHCLTYGKYAFEFNDMPDGEILMRLKEEIKRFFPAMPDEPFFSEIYRWREAVCLAPPGMLTAISRMKKESLREVKGLFLAGEYMYMPSVEGALRSGIDAAEACLSG